MELIEEILDKHITKYFDNSNSTRKLLEKILSTNASIAPITASIQRRTSEAIAEEHVARKTKSSWGRIQWWQTGIMSFKSRCPHQVLHIQHNFIPKQTKKMTLESTIFAQSTAPALTTVMKAMERRETFAHVKRIGQIRRISLQLQVRYPLDVQP